MRTEAKISELIEDLKSNDGQVRVEARRILVARGFESIIPLTLLAQSGKYWERWEAVKALGEMNSTLAMKALINALRDEKFEIRWLAAEALIGMGLQCLIPLMKALMECPDSRLLHQGAHHVIVELLEYDKSDPMIRIRQALESNTASVEVPFAASLLLNTIQATNTVGARTVH